MVNGNVLLTITKNEIFINVREIQWDILHLDGFVLTKFPYYATFVTILNARYFVTQYGCSRPISGICVTRVHLLSQC